MDATVNEVMATLPSRATYGTAIEEVTTNSSAQHPCGFPIRPVLGRVIIKIETTGEAVSDGGIIISLDSDRGEAQREGTDRVGVVMAIDEDFYNSPRNAAYTEPSTEDGPGAYIERKTRPDVQLGDRVFFQVSWAGEEFTYEGELYHVLEGEDAAAFVPDGVTVEAATR